MEQRENHLDIEIAQKIICDDIITTLLSGMV